MFFETKLKENLGVFSCSDAIIMMLECFLHFTIAFKIRWPMLSEKVSQSPKLGIFRFFTTDEKKIFSSFTTFLQSVYKESFSLVKLIPSEDWTLFDKNSLVVFQTRLLSVTCFSFSFAK